MKKIVRNVLASAISVALLAGCSDDKKDDPVNPPIYGEDGTTGDQGPNGPIKGEDGHTGDEGPDGPIGGNDGHTGDQGPNGKSGSIAVLYGPNSDWDFHLAATDKNDALDLIDQDGEVRLENVITKPLVEGERDNGLNIAITDGFGSILSTSVSDQGIDLSTQAYQGTLQFDIKVNENPNKKDVAVVLSDDSGNSDIVDITSAINAFTGATTQSIAIPLNCFDETNFSEIVKPFSLVTEADLNFDLSNVRYLRDTVDTENALECESESEVFKGPETLLFERLAENNEDGDRIIGDMNRRTPYNGSGTGWSNEGEFKHGGFYPSNNDEDNVSGDVGVVLRYLNNQISTKDLSNFIESGYLSFDLYLEHSGDYPKTDFEVWFSTADISDDEELFDQPETKSNYYPITDIDEGKWYHVQVDLKNLFADQNGQIDINKVKNIKNLVIKTDVIKSDDSTPVVKSPKFYFNNIKLVDKHINKPI